MYTLTFTQEQLGILNLALGEIPHKLASPLIVEINRQIAEAQKPVDTKEPDPQSPAA